MKTFPSFLVLISIFFIVACNNAPKSTTVETATPSKTTVGPTDIDTISYETFLEWTLKWDTFGVGYNDTALVKYYHFPVIDLSEFVDAENTNAFFYQGLEPLGAGKYEAHLILTNTNNKGKRSGQYYDVSTPCPRFCGPFE